MPDQGTRAPARSFEFAGALVAILAFGLALRLIIAYVLLPDAGFGVDIQTFRAWAANLAAQGPNGFYGRGFFVDYTPGYLYVLWLVGVVGNAIGGIGDLIKLPAIVGDVVLAWIVHSMVVELGGSRRAGRIAALLIVVNPVIWFDSAVWGQVDSVGLPFLLLGLRELWRRRSERAAILAVVAAIIKPQLGIFVPILAIVLLRRHLIDPYLARRAAAPDMDPGDPVLPTAPEDPAVPAALGARADRLLDRLGVGPIRLLTSGGLAVLTAAILSFPFGLSFIGLLEQVGKTAGGYPYLTVNAYNPWALLTSNGSGLAATGVWLRDAPGAQAGEDATLILGIPAVIVGTVLLLLVIAVICAVVYRRGSATEIVEAGPPNEPGAIRAFVDDRRTLLIALAVLALAFYVVPTRVHERYMFPFFAIGAILAATSVRWRLAYVVVALANFANLYAILLWPFYKNPGVTDWLGISDTSRSTAAITVVALAQLAVFLWALTELRPSAARRLDVDALIEADAGGGEDVTAEEPEDRGAVVVTGAGSGTAATGAATAGVASAGLATSALDPQARPSGPGFAMTTAAASSLSTPDLDVPEPDSADFDAPATGPSWLPFDLSGQSILRDRTRWLRHEGGGRFDRLDLWLLVVFVVAALLLRTFRLEEPYRMHFDEVYHARTATEFLQDWRYGQPHEIYEFTHPHLAKYAMAVGLVAFGDDKVTATSNLGGSVRDVLVEPRWDDPTMPDGRAGDRFYVLGGDQLRAYDLQTRALLATWAAPGGRTMALDQVGHRLIVGSDDGTITTLETTTQLDTLRRGGTTLGARPGTTGPPPALDAFGSVGAPIAAMVVTDDGSGLAVATTNDELIAIDPVTADVLGRTQIKGITGLADGGTGKALVADPSAISGAHAAATALAAITFGDAAAYEKRLTASGAAATGQVVVMASFTNEIQQNAIQAAITDGRLVGFSIAPIPDVAVADAAGISFVTAASGEVVSSVTTAAAVTGLTKVVGLDNPELYVTLANQQIAEVKLAITTGTPSAPSLQRTLKMPGPVRDVTYDPASQMIHVLGTAPDGSGDTIYVVEPHADAVYADARLPFAATAWAIDADPNHPSADREEILAASATGNLASVDTGSHAFAWRLPGVIAGAFTIGFLFLLVRILFRRRDIAVIAAILALADGMLFVQSRIGMNDVYVGLFIVAAYMLFAPIWTGRWRSWWAFFLVLPIVGVLLGLALASKWVGLYAIAGIVVLTLGRSALGRVLLILSFVLGTTILGYMALEVPAGAVASGNNYAFAAMMIAATLAMVIFTVVRPIRWSDEEVRLAVGGPAALGILTFLVAIPLGIASKSYPVGPVAATPLELALALVAASGVVYLVFRVAGAWGLGPLAPIPGPDDPVRLAEPSADPPSGWLRPGALLGLPIVWAAISLVVIPLAVYVISYLPWVALGNRLTDAWPPGHTGQTLLQLTESMYNYHNGLRAAHAASSPYWAWPFDLKPVWFYQGSFSGNTAGAIYDAGNLIAWWLAIPAMVFVAWQAFKRRSLALGLVFVAFAFQWMPWARIDRATFQYHFYSSVPFTLVALAYMLAELRRGASALTWLVVRLAAALAVLGPALLWLFKSPLCTIAGAQAGWLQNGSSGGSPACIASTPGQIVVTARVAGLVVVLLVFGLVLVYQLAHLGDPDDEPGSGRRRFTRIAATVLVAGVGFLGATVLLPDTTIVNQDGFSTEPIALVILVALSPLAWVVATARDARRFVAGIILACIVWFVIWYPNLSGLPLPSTIVNAYQGLLPTYLWPFQFPVNTDPVVTGTKLINGTTELSFVLLLAISVIVGYAAWTWRIALAERDADNAGIGDGPGLDGGPTGRPLGG